MNDEDRQQRPQMYEIVIDGLIDARWAEWLGGMSVEPKGDGTTRLRGEVIDQAALHGILTRLRDLGIPLLLVRRLSDADMETKETGGK